MKIQSRTEYGVRALILLAAVKEGETLSKARIAELDAIPLAFLEQILAALRRAGLIEAVRGAGGGYRLARPADQITLAEVIRTLEGSLSPFPCVHETQDAHEVCPRVDGCRTRHVWLKVTASITAALEGLTLAEVCS